MYKIQVWKDGMDNRYFFGQVRNNVDVKEMYSCEDFNELLIHIANHAITKPEGYVGDFQVRLPLEERRVVEPILRLAKLRTLAKTKPEKKSLEESMEGWHE